jgi:hypothetical protein
MNHPPMQPSAELNRQILCAEIQRLEENCLNESSSFRRQGVMQLTGNAEENIKIVKPAWVWTGKRLPWEDSLFKEHYTDIRVSDHLQKSFQHEHLMMKSPRFRENEDRVVMRLVSSQQGHRPASATIREGQWHRAGANLFYCGHFRCPCRSAAHVVIAAAHVVISAAHVLTHVDHPQEYGLPS